VAAMRRPCRRASRRAVTPGRRAEKGLSSGTRTGRRRPPEGGEGWAAHHCLTGDLVDSPATDLDAWMPELARLTARHGVFAVLGNHDRRTGADRVAAALARWSGWRLLRDEVATIEVAGARLHLVGLEERPEGQAADALPDLVARVPGGEPFVVLAHRPSVLPVAAAVGVPLVLAGHTRRAARRPRRAAAERGASPAIGLRGGVLRARRHAAVREPRSRDERAAAADRRAARDQRADVDGHVDLPARSRPE